MFKTNPSRTWMTILGMGVGTGAVVLLVGLGFGLQGILLEQIILGETLLSLNVSNPSLRTVTLDTKQIGDIANFEHVKDASPMTAFSALVTYEGLTGNISLNAAGPSYFRYAGVTISDGKGFEDDNEAQEADRVLLTQGALKLFNVEAEEMIGRAIQFRVIVSRGGESEEVQEVPLPKTYKIMGITKEPSAVGAYILLSEASSYFSIKEFERLQVRVESSDYLDEIQQKIIEKGFRVTALSKTVDQANKIFQGVQTVLAVFGGIALIVSAIGMFNTMTVTRGNRHHAHDRRLAEQY